MEKLILTPPEREDVTRIAALPYPWGKLKNSTVFVSGGSGFIGSFLLAVLRERNTRYGDNIRLVSLSRRPHTSEGIEYLSANVEEPISWAGDADFVVHLASNTHPAQYAADPVGTITANVLGCRNLLELARKKNAKRFLLASSVEIYGSGSETPFAETDFGYLNCNTARAGYNEAKRVSESLSQSYLSQYGVDCTIARFARVFGADRKEDTKAMSQFLERALAGEDVVLKSEGKQRYSYCYVADAVSGLLAVLLLGKSGEAYNVSEEDEGLTLGGYAQSIASLAGKKAVFDFDNKQAGASVASFALLNADKLKALGWKPFYSVSEGLRRTMEIKRLLAK